jgi:hypothetical protein
MMGNTNNIGATKKQQQDEDKALICFRQMEEQRELNEQVSIGLVLLPFWVTESTKEASSSSSASASNKEVGGTTDNQPVSYGSSLPTKGDMQADAADNNTSIDWWEIEKK